MTQPKFAPIAAADEVRPTYHLAPPRAWVLHRPSEFRPGERAPGALAGAPGPDQGYALHLATLFADRLVTRAGEHSDDVLAGAVAIATRCLSLFGRAPVATDIELALELFGYLGDAPDELVAFRQPLFAGAAHHYDDQRAIAHLVPVETLRLTPAAVRADPMAWREAAATTETV